MTLVISNKASSSKRSVSLSYDIRLQPFNLRSRFTTNLDYRTKGHKSKPLFSLG